MAIKKAKTMRKKRKAQVKKPIKTTRAGSQRRSVKKLAITEDTSLLIMEQRFADEYLIDYNQTNAAIRAGYSPKSARCKASQLKKQINIAAYIAHKIADTSTRNGIEFDRIMKECARIAFVNPLKVFDVDSGSLKANIADDDAAAISGVKVKKQTGRVMSTEREIKFHAKDKALELLLKHVRISAEFKEKIKIEKEKLALQRRQVEIEERKMNILEANAQKEKEGDKKILNILDPFGEIDGGEGK